MALKVVSDRTFTPERDDPVRTRVEMDFCTTGALQHFLGPLEWALGKLPSGSRKQITRIQLAENSEGECDAPFFGGDLFGLLQAYRYTIWFAGEVTEDGRVIEKKSGRIGSPSMPGIHGANVDLGTTYGERTGVGAIIIGILPLLALIIAIAAIAFIAGALFWNIVREGIEKTAVKFLGLIAVAVGAVVLVRHQYRKRFGPPARAAPS